jgi:hypothetical protein
VQPAKIFKPLFEKLIERCTADVAVDMDKNIDFN